MASWGARPSLPYLWLLLQECSERQGILTVLTHAQGQRLQAPMQQPAGMGIQGAAKVVQLGDDLQTSSEE